MKTSYNLVFITFILLLVGFASCSDQIPTIDNDQTSPNLDTEIVGNNSVTGPAEVQTLMIWGDDTYGQISDVPDGSFKAVSGGSIIGLALRRDWTPVLWGSGPIGPPPIPDELTTEKFRVIDIARDDAVLIRQDRTLAAFGQNELLTNVPAGSYRTVTVALVHAVAIADDGTLETWGSDSFPPPSGPFASPGAPLLITGLLNAPKGGPFKDVEASSLYSLALHEDGTLYGWGLHDVLDGWMATPEDPKIFYLPGQKFKAITAGILHALAIRPDGTVTGWGNGTSGALEAPMHVRFKAVAAGHGFSVGLSTDGTLWGWGAPIGSPVLPMSDQWTFADQGWSRYGDTEFYYVPNERFKSIAAAAFNIMAITVGP